MHGLKSRPMVIDGGVVPRPMVYIALTVRAYDAFGLIGSTFRELDWKTLIFFESAVPISLNAW